MLYKPHVPVKILYTSRAVKHSLGELLSPRYGATWSSLEHSPSCARPVLAPSFVHSVPPASPRGASLLCTLIVWEVARRVLARVKTSPLPSPLLPWTAP